MLILNNICKSFNGKQVLKNVNLCFNTNNCYAILGRNGIGKTTLLNILYGLIKPDSGDISYKGKILINDSPSLDRMMGLSTGNEYLLNEFTGFEFLRFVTYAFKCKNDILDDDIIRLFNYFFENVNDIYKPISTYSYGMKKKISICASILHKPEILLLDEPFSGLDSFSGKQLLGFLEGHIKGRIHIIASHDLLMVSKIASDLVVIDNQEIVYQGTLLNFTENGYKDIDESLLEIIKSDNKNLDSINFIF